MAIELAATKWVKLVRAYTRYLPKGFLKAFRESFLKHIPSKLKNEQW